MNLNEIAMISQEFPPYTFGGVGSNCYDLAFSLSKKGIYVTVFSGNCKKLTIEKLSEHLRVVRLPFFDMPPRPVWFQLQNFNTLSKLLTDCDVLHGQDTSAAFAVSLKRKVKKPLVTSIHGVPLRNLRLLLASPISELTIGDFIFHVIEYPLHDFLTRVELKGSDHVITCGLTTLRDIASIYGKRSDITFIPNGINFDKIDNITDFSRYPENDDKLSMIFYGRLFYRKGIVHLLRAMPLLLRQFRDAKLNIYGRGPLEQKLKKLAQSLGLEHNVHFRGYVSYRELILAIKRADVVVLPSLYEVGPFIAALEAMACKKPIVAFNLPFTREFMRHMWNCALAKPGDVEDLSIQMYLLLTNDKLRRELGENAYRYVKERYDWDRLSERYLEVYQKLCSDRK